MKLGSSVGGLILEVKDGPLWAIFDRHTGEYLGNRCAFCGTRGSFHKTPNCAPDDSDRYRVDQFLVTVRKVDA